MSDRNPWNAGAGLPQLFRIADIVRVRRDDCVPAEWREWTHLRMRILGARVDDERPGRVCYVVCCEGWSFSEPMAEDWLESAT